jgi:putative transposase
LYPEQKFKATTDSNHVLAVAPNRLNRNFKVTEPNKARVSDITYISSDEGWRYLAGIKDIFSGESVGYAMHHAWPSSSLCTHYSERSQAERSIRD